MTDGSYNLMRITIRGGGGVEEKVRPASAEPRKGIILGPDEIV